jgi:hypothetical protein
MLCMSSQPRVQADDAVHVLSALSSQPVLSARGDGPPVGIEHRGADIPEGIRRRNLAAGRVVSIAGSKTQEPHRISFQRFQPAPRRVRADDAVHVFQRSRNPRVCCLRNPSNCETRRTAHVICDSGELWFARPREYWIDYSLGEFLSKYAVLNLQWHSPVFLSNASM